MDKLPIFNQKLISPYTPGGSPIAARIPHEWYHTGATHISISGPRDTGKSVLVVSTLLIPICLTNPGTQVAVVRKEASTLYNTIIQTFEQDVIAGGLTYGVGFKFNRSRWEMIFDNGSRIIFGGFGGSDAGGKILGGKYDVVFYNQIEREDNIQNYANLIGCMVEGRGGHLFLPDGTPHFLFIGDANPGPPKHWWYKMRHEPHMLWYNLMHVDHPLFRDFETGELNERGVRARHQLKSAYPDGWSQQRMVDGAWVGAAGLIYPMITQANFRPVKREEIKPDWTWVPGIDYGHIDPNVCDYWAFSPDRKKAIFYKSIYRSQILTKTFADMIKKLEADENIEPAWRVADHDTQLSADLRDYGVSTRPAIKNDIPSDLEFVRGKLMEMEVTFNTNMLNHKPDVHLLNRGKSINGMQEIESYAHKDEEDQKGDGKDDYPADGQDDHSMDIMKYVFRSVLSEINVDGYLGNVQKTKPSYFR